MIYEGCYSTSNDAAPGMSGGAGLALRPEEDENRRLRILGVNSSVSPIPGAGSLVEEHWTGGDVVTASPTPGFSASVSGSTANFALRLARLTPAIQTDASRDYDYDFRQLPPNTQPADFGLAEGANPEGLLSSTFYQPGSDVPAGCDTASDPKCQNVLPRPGKDVGAQGRNDLLEYSCRDAFNVPAFVQDDGVRIANGFALGFMGEVTEPYDRLDFDLDSHLNNPDLASIHVICAPWSEAPWSINWQDLVFSGKRRPDAGVLRHSLDLGHAFLGSNFSRNLPAMFEVRKPAEFQDYDFVDPFPVGTSPRGNDLLTPPSFLMCPPGSAMNSVEVI